MLIVINGPLRLSQVGVGPAEAVQRPSLSPEVADLPVIQYRDEILQLVWVDETLPERRTKTRKIADDPDLDALQVVVCTVEGLRVGLIVYRILDIIDQSMKVTRPSSREGVETCVVVEERVTEIIDIRALIRLSDPGFFERGVKPSSGGR